MKQEHISTLSDKYIIVSRNNKGSFSSIYDIYNIFNKQTNIVLKVEKKDTNNCIHNELSIYKKLINTSSNLFVPIIYDYFETNNYNMLVLENVGDSLDILLRNSTFYNKYYFNKYHINYMILKDSIVNMILKQGLKVLSYLHSNSIIHRDIKPENLVYNFFFLKIIDFGLSIDNNEHKKSNDKYKFVGTTRYCSIDVYNNKEHKYLDDLESFLFVIIYLLNGYLPWQMGLKYEFVKKSDYNKYNLLKFVNNNEIKNIINKIFIYIDMKKNKINESNYNVNYLNII